MGHPVNGGIVQSPIKIAIFSGNWPVPSESPACLKLMTWLRMAGIPYAAEALKGPPRSKTGKAPYMIRPDGTVLDDSSIIIDELTRERGVLLDADRSADERAMMVLVQRTVESHLYFVTLLQRWRDHWPATREAYFGGKIPRPVLAIVAPILRRQALAQTHGHGLGRRPQGQIDAEAAADLDALAQVLGEREFFFGSPGVTDAIVYGTLENARACPVPGVIKDVVTSSPRWMKYLDGIKARYWDASPQLESDRG
jgi:glutathione S-transferase